MDKPSLFLAPRSNETSRENFLATLDSGYPFDSIKEYLSETEKEKFDSKKLYIWGNQEGKKRTWEKMMVGDYVAFYAKGEFVYVGKCIFKKKSSGLARELWGEMFRTGILPGNIRSSWMKLDQLNYLSL